MVEIFANGFSISGILDCSEEGILEQLTMDWEGDGINEEAT